MFGFFKSMKPAAMEGMLKQFLTPDMMQGVVESAREKAAALRQKYGVPVMGTIGQDETTGDFVLGLYRQAEADWDQVGALTIATGSHLHALVFQLLANLKEDENSPEHPAHPDKGTFALAAAPAGAEPGAEPTSDPSHTLPGADHAAI